MRQQGISPQDRNIDWAKVQDMQNNADAFKAYWQDPNVQQGFQQQAELGRQAAAGETTEDMAARKEYEDRGLEPGPAELSPEGKELRAAADERNMYKERGLEPGPYAPQPEEQPLPVSPELQTAPIPPATPEMQQQQPQPPQPEPAPPPPPQQQQPPQQPGGGQGDQQVANAIKAAITEVMSKYWS